MTAGAGEGRAARWARLSGAGVWAALALFVLVTAAQVYLFSVRPESPDFAAGFTTAETLRLLGPPRTVFLRPLEVQALDAATVAACFCLLVGVLGVMRLRRRPRRPG